MDRSTGSLKTNDEAPAAPRLVCLAAMLESNNATRLSWRWFLVLVLLFLLDYCLLDMKRDKPLVVVFF